MSAALALAAAISVLNADQTAGVDSRVRAEVTLWALAALTLKLGGLREGRKSIIFVSQGPPSSLGFRDGSLQDAIRTIVEAANRGTAAVYPLDPTGLTMEARLGDRGTLYQLAAETGGRTRPLAHCAGTASAGRRATAVPFPHGHASGRGSP